MQFVQAMVLSLKDHGNDGPARNMLAPVPVVLALLAGAAHGAPLTTEANCGGVLSVGLTYANCAVGATSAAAVVLLGGNTVSVEALATVSQTTNAEGSSAEAGIADDFLLTVTGGLEQGYYSTCVDAGAGEVERFGGGIASAYFGGAGAGSEADFSAFGCSPPVPFVAAVGQVIPLSLGASASAFSAYAEGLHWFPISEGEADALATVHFFDSSMNPASNVTYSLIPLDINLGIPEPASQWLVVSGLLMMAFLRSRRRGERVTTIVQLG